MPDAHLPAGGSLPGAMSTRTDLGPAGAFRTQPLRVPTGGDYGTAKQVEQMQAARPLRDATTPPPAAPAGRRLPPVSPGAAPGPVPQGLAGMHPDDALAIVGGPTAYPQEPLVAGGDPLLSAAFRAEVLKQLANTPYASPATKNLYAAAQAELADHLASPRPPVGMLPGGPGPLNPAPGA